MAGSSSKLREWGLPSSCFSLTRYVAPFRCLCNHWINSLNQHQQERHYKNLQNYAFRRTQIVLFAARTSAIHLVCVVRTNWRRKQTAVDAQAGNREPVGVFGPDVGVGNSPLWGDQNELVISKAQVGSSKGRSRTVPSTLSLQRTSTPYNLGGAVLSPSLSELFA